MIKENGWHGHEKTFIPRSHSLKRWVNVLLCTVIIIAIFFTYRNTTPSIEQPPQPADVGPSASDVFMDTHPDVGFADEQKPEELSPGDQPINVPPANGQISKEPKLDKEQSQQADANGTKGASKDYTATIVMGRMDKEPMQVQWARHDLFNVQKTAIYIVDDPNTKLLHLERNHGREARVYLTYIIDNYDKLSDITFFWHADRNVWHNNILLGWDSVNTINKMNREYIMQQGYVPSRCDHWPGCPTWITFNPTKVEHRLDPHLLADMFNDKLFGRLFPNETNFPPHFAETCCSQFAVSRKAIRNVNIEIYKRLRDWIDEYWSDQATGRMMEMMWQYIFLGKGVLCPSMSDCYCKTYDICLENEEEIMMLEKWDDYRLRFHQLHNQQIYAEKEWERKTEELKGLGKERKAKIKDDPEYNRLREDYKAVKQKADDHRDRIRKHWKLPDPPTQW